MLDMFIGIGTAMVTPFSGGKTDMTAFENLVRLQIKAGTDALIVNGTTGEASTLTDGEMCALVECAKHLTAGKIPVIAGAGANCTLTAVRRARRMVQSGADALLCVTPYYNKANAEGLSAHFRAIADASDVPVILYNVPGRTGVDLPVQTAMELFRHPMIRGVKEASQDPKKIAQLIGGIGSGGYVYAGDDIMLLPMMSLGAAGGISVLSNAFPVEMRKISSSALDGDYERARSAHSRLLPAFSFCMSDINPIPVKALLSAMGLIQNELRLPLTPAGSEIMKKAESLLKAPEYEKNC